MTEVNDISKDSWGKEERIKGTITNAIIYWLINDVEENRSNPIAMCWLTFSHSVGQPS